MPGPRTLRSPALGIFLLTFSTLSLPTPAAETAPATQPAGPKQALAAMLRSLLAGDEPATLQALVFASADSRLAGQALLRQVFATASLRRAVIQQFDARGQDSVIGRREEDDLKAMLAALDGATLRATATTAEITLEKGPQFFLVKQEDAWRIDFDKSQHAMAGMPTKAEADAARQRADALDALWAMVSARQFASLEQIETRYNAILAGPDKPTPATRPRP